MNMKPAKNLVKKHCPAFLLPFLKIPYRAAKRAAFVHRANKYLPYYQDELSREVLSARMKFLRTYDRNIFLDLAEKSGITFKNLTNITQKNGYTNINQGDYSGIVIIYDKDGNDLRYSRRLLEMCGWQGKYRIVTLSDFMRDDNIPASELVYLVLTQDGMKEFDSFTETHNVKFTVKRGVPYVIREDIQYFDVLAPVDNEIIIDAGAYDGATALQFLKWAEGRVKKIYSFELDPVNVAKCEERLKSYGDKITLIAKGTSDKDETIYITASGSTGGKAEGDTEAGLTAIDNVVKDERVTLIKMDVEGAELKSLMGAKNTILKNRPRLVICVYHKREDLYEIPGYILSLVPEYKFYLRHYCSLEWETVLYAFC